MKFEHHKKRVFRPDLMLVVTLFVGISVLVTNVVQAATPFSTQKVMQKTDHAPLPLLWVKSLWGLDLGSKIQNWQPAHTYSENQSEGWNITRPLGSRGPTLKFSTTMPVELVRTLNAGGGEVNPTSTKSDVFLFLEKRW